MAEGGGCWRFRRWWRPPSVVPVQVVIGLGGIEGAA